MQKRIRKIIAPSFTIKKTNLNVAKEDSTEDAVASPNKKDPKRQARQGTASVKRELD